MSDYLLYLQLVAFHFLLEWVNDATKTLQDELGRMLLSTYGTDLRKIGPGSSHHQLPTHVQSGVSCRLARRASFPDIE